MPQKKKVKEKHLKISCSVCLRHQAQIPTHNPDNKLPPNQHQPGTRNEHAFIVIQQVRPQRWQGVYTFLRPGATHASAAIATAMQKAGKRCLSSVHRWWAPSVSSELNNSPHAMLVCIQDPLPRLLLLLLHSERMCGCMRACCLAGILDDSSDLTGLMLWPAAEALVNTASCALVCMMCC